jgi:hypothetical protein
MRLTSKALISGIGLLASLGSCPCWCRGAEYAKAEAAVTNLVITASILVHSGEPDPSWVFTNTVEIAKLKEFITGLPTSAPPKWPILGYRGFMLTAKDKTSGFALVRVFRAVVEVRSEDGDAYYRDQKNLESFLVEQAKRRGFGKWLK